jgi:hypothetical protein
MFSTSGILTNKSLVKSGSTENGTWKIIQFLIKKTKFDKPIYIPITAKGNLAAKIDNIAIKEKIRVEFYIEGKEYNGKYYTECIATDIDKHIPKKKYEHGQVSFGNEVYDDRSDNLRTDNHLFKEENKA